jgi:hypothetical protein
VVKAAPQGSVLRGNEATPWQIALATMARRRHVFLFSIYDLNMACVSKLYASIANYVAEASAGTLIGISSAGNRLTGATPAETRRTKDMRNFELDPSLLSEQRDVAEMIADMAGSEPDICSRSASALAQVCRGIITGEGPTAAGRVHFSRTIDIQDTGLCTHWRGCYRGPGKLDSSTPNAVLGGFGVVAAAIPCSALSLRPPPKAWATTRRLWGIPTILHR